MEGESVTIVFLTWRLIRLLSTATIKEGIELPANFLENTILLLRRCGVKVVNNGFYAWSQRMNLDPYRFALVSVLSVASFFQRLTLLLVLHAALSGYPHMGPPGDTSKHRPKM